MHVPVTEWASTTTLPAHSPLAYAPAFGALGSSSSTPATLPAGVPAALPGAPPEPGSSAAFGAVRRASRVAIAYRRGVSLMLSLQTGAEEWLRRATAQDPLYAPAHAALAVALVDLGRIDEARAAAVQAQGVAAAGATLREREHTAVLCSYVWGDSGRALALGLRFLRAFPDDALVLRTVNHLLSWSGRSDESAVRWRLMQTSARRCPEQGWFLGDWAFDHAELGRLPESRELAEHALALNPQDGNAAHSLAHAFYEDSDPAGGAAFLEAWLRSYDRTAPEHSHLACHLALFVLHARGVSAAMAVYRDRLDPSAARRTGNLRLRDAAAVLWRLELAGAAGTASLWPALRPLAEPVVADPTHALDAAHAALVLASLKDEAALAQLASGLRRLAAAGHPVAGRVALPLVEGVAAFIAGDHGVAASHLEGCMDQLYRIGGSNAQRSLFQDLLERAQARARAFSAA